MSKSTTIVTAAEVRAFFRADQKRMSRLPEAAQATVREGARGRLHPEAVAEHNKRRRTRQYALGATTEAKAAKAAQREALAAKGLRVGARGPLSKEAQAALSKG